MNADFPVRYTALAEQNVLMTLIYGYKKCGLPDRAKALAAGLTGAEFASLREGCRTQEPASEGRQSTNLDPQISITNINHEVEKVKKGKKSHDIPCFHLKSYE
jgi:hypothetical protein